MRRAGFIASDSMTESVFQGQNVTLKIRLANRLVRLPCNSFILAKMANAPRPLSQAPARCFLFNYAPDRIIPINQINNLSYLILNASIFSSIKPYNLNPLWETIEPADYHWTPVSADDLNFYLSFQHRTRRNHASQWVSFQQNWEYSHHPPNMLKTFNKNEISTLGRLSA